MIPKERCYSLDSKITWKQLSENYFLEYCKKFSQYEITKLQKYLQEKNIHCILKEDNDYKYIFNKIPQAPNILYYIGNIKLLNTNIVGIIGTRNPSSYASEITKEYCKIIKGFEITTISGGAEGIDIICHNESIIQGIPTICILGGGIHYYLGKNKFLEQILSSGGLIISEFKIFSKPEKYTFPMRNRIIAGLSNYLCIIEAGEHSGSLITANYMEKLHKPIFGIVGNILQKNNIGLHEYLEKNRIKPIYNIKLFCESYFKKKEKHIIDNVVIATTIGEKILSYKNGGSISFDNLINNLGLQANEVLTEISILELNNLIEFKQNIIFFN